MTEKMEQDVFDIEIAKSKLNAENVKDLVAKSEIFIVDSDETAKEGLTLAMQSRKMGNAIEAARKEIVRPHLDFQKAVKKYSDGFSECLKKMEKTILSKVEIFQTAKELELKKARDEQIKRETEARLKHEKEQREYEEAIKKRDLEIAKKEENSTENKDVISEIAKQLNCAVPCLSKPIQQPLKPLPIPQAPTYTPEAPIAIIPKKIASDEGSYRTVVEWVFEIENKNDIPREFLIVDEKAIKSAVKEGLRELNGVRIFERSTKKYRIK